MSVEDLLSEKGKVRSEVSVIYANSARRGVDVANPILLQTSPNTTIALPTQIGERLSNTDALITNAGLRYGLSKNSEIYGRASAIQTNQRFDNLQGSHTTSDSQFADAWVGLNYRFRNDIDRAAWIGFAELQLAEKPIDTNTTYGKSAVFGFTTYQTYDPVVLSLTASTQVNAKRTINGVGRGSFLLLCF